MQRITRLNNTFLAKKENIQKHKKFAKNIQKNRKLEEKFYAKKSNKN